MKDIYEHLNDVDISETEYEEMAVTDLEKAKIKKRLRESIINQQKKANGWKKTVAASIIIIGLSTAALGVTFPAYASTIPVIGDIFKFLDPARAGLYDNYKEYSSEMNLTEQSNGIKMTINNAIYDGETVSLAFSIESDQNLGDNPYLHGLLDIKGAQGGTGGSQITRVNDNNYVGLITASNNFKHPSKNKVNIKWRIDRIISEVGQKEIEGDWSFAFALEATDNQTQIINQSAEHDGVIVNLSKISVTPMSFIVFYDQAVSESVQKEWHMVDVDIEIKDDWGNRYSGKGNGSLGDRDGYNMAWSKTFQKLDPRATKLIVTPRITRYEYTSENHGSVGMTEAGTKEMQIPEKPGKGIEEYTLDDITIELKN
ncbi:ECF-type sigma factor negative effector [Paenibacillus radicis (ex Gao et al. 2016)]|uniref:ECF-type sigma factor negative effector n=2 Tax=Paenibacillus radicis (ex Gao et al. 2016) TaxID=1737354 RepID=A0A917HAB9_9BACL|nr:ECF-type sigma factor negative effector [Paenibacillus radicis (ex Gao et al. 2016)]